MKQVAAIPEETPTPVAWQGDNIDALTVELTPAPVIEAWCATRATPRRRWVRILLTNPTAGQLQNLQLILVGNHLTIKE